MEQKRLLSWVIGDNIYVFFKTQGTWQNSEYLRLAWLVAILLLKMFAVKATKMSIKAMKNLYRYRSSNSSN